MNRFILILLFLIFSLPIQADNATNVRARQEGNTVVITYDLSAKSNVKVYFSINNTNDFKELKSVTGDVGIAISAGNNRTIVWHALDDYEKIIAEDVCFKVEAKDYTTLSLSKYSVSAQEWGTTEYIRVMSDKPWSVENISGEMFYASRIGSSVKVEIYSNTGESSRNDHFYIKTNDGKEKVKVTLSQKGVESKSTITYKYKSPSAYRSYCDDLGTFELIFCGTSGAIGNGGLWGVKALSCRMGPVQINPLEIGVYAKDERKCRFYTPSVDFYIPINCCMALYFGGGPTFAAEIKDSGTDGKTKFSGIDASVGFHWGWAEDYSSDFFFRYNGSYMIGVSINWCMGI
jgi:hypothetical protein